MEHLLPDLAISYHEFVNIVVLSHIKKLRVILGVKPYLLYVFPRLNFNYPTRLLNKGSRSH